jgi:hypothetical protein
VSDYVPDPAHIRRTLRARERANRNARRWASVDRLLHLVMGASLIAVALILIGYGVFE